MVFVTLLALISQVMNVDKLCMKINATTGDCVLCEGSYWDATAKVCTVPTTLITKAFSYTNATTVSLCNTGYYVSGNTCATIPLTNVGCTNGSATTAGVFTCSACATGKYLSLWGQCVAIPTTNTNCADGSATSAGVFTCSLCASGYALSAGACSAIGSSFTSCTALSTNATTCTACTSGMALVVALTSCTTFTGASATNCKLGQQAGTTGSFTYTCTTCVDGYFIDTANSNNCSIIPTVNTNCQTGTGSTTAFTCTACVAGYYLNSSAACVAVPSATRNCASGTVDTYGNFSCTTCASGFSLIVNSTNTTTNVTITSCAANTTTNCPITNCSSCSSTTTCSTCAATYTLVVGSSGAADTCVVGVAKCYQGTATVCTVCSPGFYINSGACTAGIVTFFGKILSLLLVFIL